MNSYLAKLTPYYLQLAEEIEQVPDGNGVVKRSTGKLLPEVASLYAFRRLEGGIFV